MNIDERVRVKETGEIGIIKHKSLFNLVDAVKGKISYFVMFIEQGKSQKYYDDEIEIYNTQTIRIEKLGELGI